MKTAILCCALTFVSTLVSAGEVSAQSYSEIKAARQSARESVAAYRAQDWVTYEARLSAALSVQPHHPVWLYNRASVAALRGDRARALMLLDTIAALGFTVDPQQDDDFATLRNDPDFRQRAGQLAANSTRVGASEPIVALSGAAFLPEGIAYDSSSGAIFLSSVHEREIVRSENGITRTLADSSAGLWAVLGMTYSARTNSVWAVTSVVREMKGYAANMKGSALVEIDAVSGSVKRRLIPSGEEHSFNDLTLDDADGIVYVSDPGAGSVLEWSESGGWRELVPPGVIYNPSGLAIMPNTEWLYVADYVIGLTRVSRVSGKVERLSEAPGVSTYGTDGLIQFGRDLLIIQNSVQPHRVARLTLGASGSRIEKLQVLERGSPYFDEPTLGVATRNALLYVANSGWGKFRDGKYTGSPDASGPIVLGLRLDPKK